MIKSLISYLLTSAVVIAAVALTVRGIPAITLPFATIEQNATLSDGLSGCVETRVPDLGSPFRLNNYDECRTSNDLHLVAAVTNLAFWSSTLWIISFSLRSRSKRNKSKIL